jgi:hypothetical protein
MHVSPLIIAVAIVVAIGAVVILAWLFGIVVALADGFTDLVIKIEDVGGTFTQGSGTATLTGNLLDGTPILGTGDICITRPYLRNSRVGSPDTHR